MSEDCTSDDPAIQFGDDFFLRGIRDVSHSVGIYNRMPTICSLRVELSVLNRRGSFLSLLGPFVLRLAIFRFLQFDASKLSNFSE